MAAFVEAYPTRRCARHRLGDVLRWWQGLGYPRRARNLQATARVVVERHDGRLPDDLDALLALPGIGPYTARAVLAFAFERDAAVVDTNIARVLARPPASGLTPKRAQAMADELVPSGDGWVWNQVIMDLGATVCRPVPTCDVCPVAASCSWHVAGRPDPDPAVGSAGVSTRQARFEGSDRQSPRPCPEGAGRWTVPCSRLRRPHRRVPRRRRSHRTPRRPTLLAVVTDDYIRGQTHDVIAGIGGCRPPDLRLQRASSQRLLPSARCRGPRARP